MVVLHVTEFAVLVSLMGVGLAIERALDLRSWRSWRTWSPVWRLLLVTMPLTILGIALLGGGSRASRRPSRCSSARSSPRPTRRSPRTSRWASPSPRTSRNRPTRTSTLRGRRHPVLPDRRGRSQRRLGLPVRRPGTPAAGGRLRGPRRWGLARVVRRGQDRARCRGRAGARWMLGRQAFRARRTLRLADPGEPLLALAGLLAGTARRSSSAATASWRSSPARCGRASSERKHSYQRAMHGVPNGSNA